MATTKDHVSDREALTAALEGQTIWNTSSLTYNFAMDGNRAAFVSDPGTSAHVFTGIRSFNALDVTDINEANIQRDVESAMAAWSRVANIPLFVETTDYSAADIKIAGVDNYDGVAGSMYLPGTNARGPLVVTPVDYESYLLLNTSLSIVPARGELGRRKFRPAPRLARAGPWIGA